MRRVISLWLPRFTTDRIGRSRPDWRDSPLATVQDADRGLRLQAVDRAAEAGGLVPGQPLADARAVLPSLRTVPADPAADARALAALAEWCGRYSPWVAVDPASGVHGGGGIWIEATGVASLFGGETAMLADLSARLRRIGLTARAAIADTPGAAWAVARYATAPATGARDPLRVLAGETRAALAPLPVAALRLAPGTAMRLEELGLRRIAALYDIPRAALATRFGAEVADRLDAALGHVAEPISPAPPPIAHAARLDFPEPIGRPEDIAAGLDRLLVRLCAGLEQAAAGARALSLWLYRPDGTVERREVGTSRANRTPAHLARLFAERIADIDLGFGFETMRLVATTVEPLGADQPSLAPRAMAASAEALDIEALVDRLSNRLGRAAVRRLAPVASHIPERAVLARPALAAPPAAACARWVPPGAPPRPLRLLAPPEPIEATALVPDDPPVLFRWRRIVHRIVRAEGPERIAPEWWRPADGRAESRDYYRVEDSAGGRFWLYREGIYRPGATPAWYLHGVFG